MKLVPKDMTEKEQYISLEKSVMRHLITTSRMTTILLSRVYKQMSKCHIELKYKNTLSFVCKGAWGRKMIT